MGCDAFATTDEAEPLIRGRLDADAADIDLTNFGDPPAHRVAVRTYFGRFRNEGQVEMRDYAATCRDPAHRVRQETIR